MGIGDVFGKIGAVLGKAAPVVGGLLGGPAAGAVVSLLSNTIGVEDSPDAVLKALEADPGAVERIRRLELQQRAELVRLRLTAETNRIEQDTKKIAEVNQTMRIEAASNFAYVRNWRPTWGYATAFSWTVQSIAIAGVIIFAPERAGVVAQLVGALTPMWGIAMVVLGVAAKSRSEDKGLAAGHPPKTGLLSALASKISK